MKGRVKWWNYKSNCGFIELNDKENLFAHIDKNDDCHIKENQEIEFTIDKRNEGNYLKILSTSENKI